MSKYETVKDCKACEIDDRDVERKATHEHVMGSRAGVFWLYSIYRAMHYLAIYPVVE